MVSYKPNHNAPKLRAYLGKRIFLHDPLIMKRQDWELLKEGSGNLFDVDVFLTPMGNEKILSKVLGCIAKKIDFQSYEVKVYRYDQKDDPPFNVDTYKLYEDFARLIDFNDYVIKATTSNDDNLLSFLSDTVIFENVGPQCDHHSEFTKLPKSIQQKALHFL